jgi:hypothetical protein
MLRRAQHITIALVAMMTMAAPAMAATIIDFRNGAALAGGSITFDGTNVFGTDLPVGLVEIFGAPQDNGVYDVDGAIMQGATNPDIGQDGNYGDLDFNTATGDFTLSGCVPGLGVGIVAGACTNPVLLSGQITSWSLENTSRGAEVEFEAFDFKNPDLLAAIGLAPNTPFVLDGWSLLTGQLTPNGQPQQSVSLDVRNVAVPEPATMVLLGTGLLAAFRARRRTA